MPYSRAICFGQLASEMSSRRMISGQSFLVILGRLRLATGRAEASVASFGGWETFDFDERKRVVGEEDKLGDSLPVFDVFRIEASII